MLLLPLVLHRNSPPLSVRPLVPPILPPHLEQMLPALEERRPVVLAALPRQVHGTRLPLRAEARLVKREGAQLPPRHGLHEEGRRVGRQRAEGAVDALLQAQVVDVPPALRDRRLPRGVRAHGAVDAAELDLRGCVGEVGDAAGELVDGVRIGGFGVDGLAVEDVDRGRHELVGVFGLWVFVGRRVVVVQGGHLWRLVWWKGCHSWRGRVELSFHERRELRSRRLCQGSV